MARAAYGSMKVLFTDLHGPLQVYAVYIRLNMGGLYKVLTLPRSPRRQVITGDSFMVICDFPVVFVSV